MDVCGHVGMGTGAHGGRKTTSGVAPWEHTPSTTPVSQTWPLARLHHSQSHGCTYVCVPSTGTTSRHCCSWLFIRVLGTRLRPSLLQGKNSMDYAIPTLYAMRFLFPHELAAQEGAENRVPSPPPSITLPSLTAPPLLGYDPLTFLAFKRYIMT